MLAPGPDDRSSGLTEPDTEERIRFQSRMLEAVGQAVIASDANHRIVFWNRAAEDLYGWTDAEVLGRTDSEVLQASVQPEQTAEITARLAAGQSWEGEFQVRRKDGDVVPVHFTGAAVLDADGSIVGYVGVATDLRRSRELEARLRSAQKMEAVGRLAGGIAHDFNNLLTSIKGITHLMLEDLPADHPMRSDVEEIRSATDRAAALTNQLLAFSRRQVLLPRIVDINAMLEARLQSLRRFAGDAIELVTDFSPGLGCVQVDAAQFSQVVHNIVANARDAMPDGGRVTLRTHEVDVDAFAARRIAPDMRPGSYVVLEIADDGPGIPADEIDRVFEPFFTTGHTATGAGLGLSTVYGIIQQSDGRIEVDSTEGFGTTFRIYLPRVEGRPEAEGTPVLPEAAAGSETLLLVEDEESVRRLGRKILNRHGYHVLEAADGVEALEVIERHAGPLHLVVTDVVMPRMGGAELARRLRDRIPETPILFVSGYADDPRIRDSIGTNDAFLEKPFTPDALARKVRAALDARTRSSVR